MRLLHVVLPVLGILGIASCGGDDTIGVDNIAPVAAFTTSCTELSCTFTNQSSDADGTIQAHAWTFGDGGTSSAPSPAHTYAAPGGTFTVRLTVTDDRGATAMAEHEVTVAPPLPDPISTAQIAYVYDGNIYLFNAASGSGPIPLTDAGESSAIDPAWSPDGSRIAFTLVTQDPNTGEVQRVLSLMNADGSDQHSIGLGSDPAWSPDGQSLAFICEGGGLCIAGVDPPFTPVQVPLPAGITVGGRGPDWSPDGSRIAFVATDDDVNGDFYWWDIWVVAPDGSGASALTAATGVCPTSFGFESPAWAPDGQRIAFTRFWCSDVPPERHALSIMNADGSGRFDLAVSAWWSAPSWSPDGGFLAYAPATGGIDWVSADGTRTGTIVASGADPAWRP